MKFRTVLMFALPLTLGLARTAHADTPPTVLRASGDISGMVAQFRSLLGDPLNGATASEQAAGRREINWDGVPAGVTNTDTFPANFFNQNSKRGLVLATPGLGLRVSDNDFADVNPSYAAQFDAFSPAKTFMAAGSNTVDVFFEVAGSSTAAAVSGFGVVFSDVDVAGSARIELFQGGTTLGVFDAPVRSGATSLSFVGVSVGSAKITRVRITSGQGALSATAADISDGGSRDLVVMDDFLYGEPHADDDADGILGTVDEYSPSDTRARVDTTGSADIAETFLPNLTLPTGSTIQDLVNLCRSSVAPSRVRKCFKAQRNRVLKFAKLSRADRALLDAVEKSIPKK